ncbi:MAG: RecX family transcriptional regulator [Halanaerobiales bacterium]|nr:RecX family transcriptional regulator [Halanaerobiales bacterium]
MLESSDPKKKQNYEDAKNKVFLFLSYRERSEKEVRDYLKRKGYAIDVIDKVIQRLKELNYINARRFTELWVKNRVNSGRKGPELVRKELREKGICYSLIEDYISREYNFSCEYEVAYKVVQKKIKSTKDEDLGKIKIRLWKFLKQKGFRYNAISKAISVILEEEKTLNSLDRKNKRI